MLALGLALAGPAAGDPAPGFTLPDGAGRQVALSSLRGRPVVLNFWASWCAPCLRELPRFQRLQGQLGPVASVVTVSIDRHPDAAREVARRLGLSLPVLLDGANDAVALYDPDAIPTTYVLDADGVVREVLAGELDDDAMRSLADRLQAASAGPAAAPGPASAR